MHLPSKCCFWLKLPSQLSAHTLSPLLLSFPKAWVRGTTRRIRETMGWWAEGKKAGGSRRKIKGNVASWENKGEENQGEKRDKRGARRGRWGRKGGGWSKWNKCKVNSEGLRKSLDQTWAPEGLGESFSLLPVIRLLDFWRVHFAFNNARYQTSVLGQHKNKLSASNIKHSFFLIRTEV